MLNNLFKNCPKSRSGFGENMVIPQKTLRIQPEKAGKDEDANNWWMRNKKKKYLAPKITLPIGHFLLVPHIKKRKKRKKDTDR